MSHSTTVLVVGTPARLPEASLPFEGKMNPRISSAFGSLPQQHLSFTIYQEVRIPHRMVLRLIFIPMTTHIAFPTSWYLGVKSVVNRNPTSHLQPSVDMPSRTMGHR